MSYPPVTGVPPTTTTTSPTTSATQATTTTSSTRISSSNAPSTTPAPASAASTSVTYVATSAPTTITSTNPYNGATTTITTSVSTTTPISVPTPSPVNNSTNTGAIVGGVVGGIAIIALLGLLFFCLRRRRRRGGKFDPERIVSHSSGGGTQPQVDLGEETEVTPLPYPNGGGSMRQYAESPFLAAGESASGAGAGAAAAGAGIHRTTSRHSPPMQHSDTTTSPGEGYPSQGFVRPGPDQYPQGGLNMFAMQQADSHSPRPLTSPHASASNTASSVREMKEREAAAGRQGVGLATQQEIDGEGQAPAEGAGGELGDVPPAYESISQ
ncbi:hypothetical protein EDB19DRAFT_1909426 [Suillus lakei]|nr:hypothetical protein EDB19DRAFT_1909426 [Suillus lakei]